MGAAIHLFLFGSLIFQPPKAFPDLALKLSALSNARAEMAEMPRATAYLSTEGGEKRLVDRFEVFDLWRSESIRGRWCDREGNRFSVCRLQKKLPYDGKAGPCTRSEYYRKNDDALLGAKDLDRLDEAAYLLAPVEVGKRVKPRRSQRQNLSELWRYSVTNENAYVFAFRPRAGRKEKPDWYLVALVSDDPDAEEKIDSWLDEVEHLKNGKETDFAENPTETEYLARDYKRSVVNYNDWHYSCASNVVIVDNMKDVRRNQFISALTNGLSKMQCEFRKMLPSPLSDESHIAAMRIFDSREEYLSYVGPDMKWSAALWSPVHREIVLCCQETGMETLLRTVWHEALHQHLDYACSMMQTPAWFNEGHAVLFEHTHFDMDGNVVFDPVPEAVAAIKENPSAVAEYLPEFFALDYRDFYSGSHEDRALKYHIAWSIAYFLQVGAPEVRFQPFKNLRSDLMKALVETRRRDEATDIALASGLRDELISRWLTFWQKH
ncbi:MAG: hypothetical protein J6R18_09750 [Kiritimatiellae bacterium]|nr:hypothetical protein [Kiritimatiellia bacterium]